MIILEPSKGLYRLSLYVAFDLNLNASNSAKIYQWDQKPPKLSNIVPYNKNIVNFTST